MTWLTSLMKANERRATGLAVILIAQAFCALFFVFDVIKDLTDNGLANLEHMVIETIASVVLIIGIAFLMSEIRDIYARMKAMDSGLMLARGELADVLDALFKEWELTNSERDVALLMIKGQGNDDIAAIRGTAVGTVRAQSSSVFRKAGVEGRVQLMTMLLDEVLDIEIPDAKGDSGKAQRQLRSEKA